MDTATRVTRGRPGRRTGALGLVSLLVLMLALLLGAAGPAAAAPQEPIMTMARLQELLAASPTGTVDATFKTAVKGADIATIPCVIQGIVPQAAADNGDLILFQASGPVIEQAGGIAAGMSGSPVYVDDGGDKLVGAVSYGEYFTSNGLGLATPIEHMMTLEDDFQIDPLAARLAKAVPFRTSLAADGRGISQLVVAPTTDAARAAGRRPGTVVMRPVSTLQLGGVSADSETAKALKAAFARKGIELRTGLAGGAAGSRSSFETPLVPGSSVGELFMRGDTWLGGVGTTTYTTADGKLVAYGHPGMWDGYLSAFLTNADVIGLWNNAEEPHKVVAPGKVRGAITVDSGPGIAGVIGDAAMPASVPFTSTATNAATGKTVTSTSYVTQWAADQYKYPYYYAYAMSFYPAMYQVTGDAQYDGHLTFTLTIGMTDGSDDYTITRTNAWEDSYGWDASYLAVVEIGSLLSTLTTDPDGTIDPHITAIDLDCTLSPQHQRARIVDVSVPGGVHTGDTVVHVTMYAYGDPVARVETVHLDIPEGMSTKGTVYAKAPFTNVESLGDGWYGFWSFGGQDVDPPKTLADVVAGLDGAPGNDHLLVAYDPPGRGWEDDWGMSEPWSDEAVTADVPMGGAYLTGEVAKSQAEIQLYQQSGPAVAGRTVRLGGYLSAEGADLSGTTVKIYTRDAGETTDTFVEEVPVEAGDEDEGGGYSFSAAITARHTTTVTATWEGNDDYLPSSASRVVKVRAVVGLTATRAKSGAVHLTARLRPADTGGKVVFARLARGRLVPLRTVAVDARGRAVWTWEPKAGCLPGPGPVQGQPAQHAGLVEDGERGRRLRPTRTAAPVLCTRAARAAGALSAPPPSPIRQAFGAQ